MDSIFTSIRIVSRWKFVFTERSIKYCSQTLGIFIVQLEIDLSLMAFTKKLCSSFNGTRNKMYFDLFAKFYLLVYDVIDTLL
jgi:hypothetical protein